MKKTLIIVMISLLGFLAAVQNAGAAAKASSAISPYFQTDNNSVYTFIGISHPSLNTAMTNIGLTIQTVGAAGASGKKTFTISAGETYRIFIASTNHSSVNSLNITGDRVLFIGMTTGSTVAGSLLFTGNKKSPAARVAGTTKFNNLRQLTIWGAVV
ncbi:MAG: hypothetical protein ACE5GQ_11430, partial [Nitrospinales bacterium]